MGNKVRYIFMGLFVALFIGCLEDIQDEEYAQIPLSEDARLWFSEVQNESVDFKSTNGLSDRYQFTIRRSNPLIEANGLEGYGEQIELDCAPTLGKDKFWFKVSNFNMEEHIQLEHFRVKQWFLLTSPYKQLLFDCPYYYQMHQSVLEYIGDTVLNNIHYIDIYRNYILMEEMPGNLTIEKEVYLSKSRGLIAFRVQGSVFWYRK